MRAGALPGISSDASGISGPVDPEIFKLLVEVYQAAASMRMPVPNPQLAKVRLAEFGETIAFTDSGLNRGMLAVTRQCREIGVENTPAYLARIMHLSELFEAHERFGELLQPLEDGCFALNDCVLEAAATSRFFGGLERMGFDLDDVVAKAHELAKA